jgi:hypothetical protein
MDVSEEHVTSIVSSDRYLLHTGYLLGLFYDKEDIDDMFLLRNVGWLSTYSALHPRRQKSSLCCDTAVQIDWQV